MNWINELPKLDLSKNKFSQYGEEIIIKNIFENVGTTNNYFVDIGAGGAGRNLSNTKLLIEEKWKGISLDMDGSEGTKKVFVTPFNICQTLKKFKCPKDFDFLSVDLDSFDYDIIEAVLKDFHPRVICAEFNGTLNPEIPVKLKYEEGYTWDSTNKYGFSFSAGVKLFNKFGYEVILNHKDTNMFAVQKELADIPFIRPTAKQNIYHPVNPKAEFELV